MSDEPYCKVCGHSHLAHRFAEQVVCASCPDRTCQPSDLVAAQLSPGRTTQRRPGETWAQATNRLTEGEHLE